MPFEGNGNGVVPEPRHSDVTGQSCSFDLGNELHGDVPVDQNIPTPEQLASIAELQVYAEDGSAHSFGSLHAGLGLANEPQARRMVIFIRHFFCGMCQQFVRSLTESVSPAQLASLSPPAQLSIVGCGGHEVISRYREVSSPPCPFPIYADPSRKLYESLGMTCTLALGAKPEYTHMSVAASATRDFFGMLKAGSLMRKGGNMAQVGGEFYFDVDGKCVWAHRMRNTRDHSEVEDLKKIMGLTRKSLEQANGVNGH